MLSKPDAARKGNLYAAFGMTIAIVGTMLFHQNIDHVTGAVEHRQLALHFYCHRHWYRSGWFAAMRVKMTMPQMVSLSMEWVACAALIGIVERSAHHPTEFGARFIIFLSMMIGTVSFAGSMIAGGKLEENKKTTAAKCSR